MTRTINILKISMIDWCYRIDRRQAQSWNELNAFLASQLELDVCFIERCSKDWYSDFVKYFDNQNYNTEFLVSSENDTRLSQGGTCVITRKTAQNFIKFHSCLKLPSGKPQFDGGQPSRIHVFEYSGCIFLLGCMPQNLGRDGISKDNYLDLISKFWGDGCETDVFPVAVYDKDLKLYDVHMWQLNLQDAINDDKFLDKYISESTKPVISLVEQFGIGTDVVQLQSIETIKQPKINCVIVYSNNPETFSVTTSDVDKVPRVSDTSFVKHISVGINNSSS